MVWPFKKDNPSENTRRKKFQNLGQNKLGSKKKSKKQAEPAEPAEEIEEFEDAEEYEEVAELSDDLSDFDELEESSALDALDDVGDFPELEDPDKISLDDEVDEISLEDEMESEEEIIPSNQRMGTMRIMKQNPKPPSKSAIPPLQALVNSATSKPAPTGLSDDQRKLAQALLAGGGLTHEEIEKELRGADKHDGPLGKALLNTGYVRETKLYPVLLSKYRIPRLNIQNTKIPSKTLDLISSDLANRYRAIPIEKIGSLLCLVMDNINNEEAIHAIRQATGLKIAVIQCSPEGMELTLKRYYSQPRVPQGAAEAPMAQIPLAPASGTGASTRIRALPVPQNYLSNTLPLNGRYLNVISYWHHIHVEGKRVVPEEAKL